MVTKNTQLKLNSFLELAQDSLECTIIAALWNKIKNSAIMWSQIFFNKIIFITQAKLSPGLCQTKATQDFRATLLHEQENLHSLFHQRCDDHS